MSLLRLFETVSDDCITLALIQFIDLGLLHYLRFLGFTNATQIKLTDVTDPMVNEKVADRVGEDLEGVTHKVYFDIQINGVEGKIVVELILLGKSGCRGKHYLIFS
ncbi:hypothetical protein HID58_012974 [Brassica napus]|uniref:Bet v I/Major latex protein domain-containing protein n=3 Tax=Brassica TaxID=3705 RepID=A0ABQ8E3B2_BRANA|nr:hypothetical protein HID58_012974 [Brassica napus]